MGDNFKVYFVQGENGLVKIGYSADPMRRLAALRLSNAGELNLLRLIDGGLPTERWLHKRFAEQRVAGEWFEFHHAMMSVVPPDEIPQRETIRPQLRRTLAEVLREADALGFFEGDKRLLAVFLVEAMWDDDLDAFIAWARARTGVDGG